MVTICAESGMSWSVGISFSTYTMSLPSACLASLISAISASVNCGLKSGETPSLSGNHAWQLFSVTTFSANSIAVIDTSDPDKDFSIDSSCFSPHSLISVSIC